MRRHSRPGMGTRLPLAVLLLIVLVFSSSSAEERAEEILLGITSTIDPVPWAGNDYSSAVITSPSDLIFMDNPEVLYGRVESIGSLDGGEVICIRSHRLGFATEIFHTPDDKKVNRYTLSVARPLGRRLSIGLSCTWYESGHDSLDALRSWDVGFSWRGENRLVITATGRNLLRTDYGARKLGRFYEGGVRVRLIGRKVFLFSQVRCFAGEDPGDGDPAAGVEYRVSSGLSVRGKVEPGGREDFGFEWRYQSSTIGFLFRFENGEEDGFYSYIKLHGNRHR